MAKRERRDRPEPNQEPLRKGIGYFLQGDYVRARPLLAQSAVEKTISETQRAFARSVFEATRLDRITLLVGFACVLLAGIVILTTAFLQP